MQRHEPDEEPVDAGMTASRALLAVVVRSLIGVPSDRRAAVVEGLRSLADAAGEVREPDWAVRGVTL